MATANGERPVPMKTPEGYLHVAEGVSTAHPRPFGLLDCQCDPFLRSLSTKVVSCQPVASTSKKAAPRWALRLERMPLYPTCGGQTNDLGTIGGQPVLDVVRSGFEVDHIVERSFEPGEEVTVEVDWARRMDHMCTHTGHHLLSGVLETLYGLETLSWALQPWPSPCYIEIPRKPTDEEMGIVRTRVNEIIAAGLDIRVEVRPPSAERPKSLPGDMPDGGVIRTVTIPGWDEQNCCGGTHLPSVRYLQAIHVYPNVEIVRAAKNARIYFITGPRLLHVLRTTTELSKAAAVNLGVAESDLPERVAALSVTAKDSHRRALKLRETIAEYQARDFVASLPAEDPATGLLELHDEHTHDLDHIKLVTARATAALGSRPHLLGAVSHVPNQPSILLVTGDAKRLAAIGAELKTRFGGRWRGGGKATLQGKIEEPTLNAADVAAIRGLLSMP